MSKGQKRTEEIKKKKFLLLPSSTFRGVRTIRHTKLMRLLAILAYISSYTICPIIAPFHACVQYLDVCKPKPSKRKDDDFLPRSFPSRMGKKKTKQNKLTQWFTLQEATYKCKSKLKPARCGGSRCQTSQLHIINFQGKSSSFLKFLFFFSFWSTPDEKE